MRFALSYLQYRLNAKNLHGVHSPFFYSLNKEVIRNKGYSLDSAVEELRSELKKNKSSINLVDLGAGSRIHKSNSRSVSEIVKVSSGSRKDLSFLNNLASWLNAENILELGANLGLGTIALSAHESAKKVVSIEGDPTLAAIAVKNLEKLGLNANVIQGSFEETIDLALQKLERIDLAYLDGNHKKDPTLNYFERIKEFTENNSVIAIGDIHWSDEMEQAWETIKADPDVTSTVDVFSIGLVFFKKELSKEHFILYG